MRNIEITKWNGLDHLENNKDYYKKIFLNNKIIAFRNVNADKNLQQKIMIYFGDLLGWVPNSLNPNGPDYFEDHHKQMVNRSFVEKNELMLNWHIEWVQFEENPHYGATWNMTQFDCDYDTGNTLFIDTSEIYNLLDKESAEFLDKCKVVLLYKGEKKEFNYIKDHWITGEKCVRPHMSRYGPLRLAEFDKRIPTKIEEKKFIELHHSIYENIYNNKEIVYIHRWEKGDLLVPDLFKFAHAVTGGFKENERRLDGIFGRLHTPIY